ncbi:hypothetical protein VN24_08325 [Paenibacillus beijingensis]|uniref:Uncharacterized protein n=1 Tax=Paenibacillus beijingensis TaxID=1126833 RepID=A0A0D5NHX0_9BACL|nr:hypothetical protein VN24_08325 [Paenibacillus beijingensis]
MLLRRGIFQWRKQFLTKFEIGAESPKRIDFQEGIGYHKSNITDSGVTGDEVGLTTVEHRNIRPVAWAKSSIRAIARVALFSSFSPELGIIQPCAQNFFR